MSKPPAPANWGNVLGVGARESDRHGSLEFRQAPPVGLGATLPHLRPHLRRVRVSQDLADDEQHNDEQCNYLDARSRLRVDPSVEHVREVAWDRL